MIPSDHLVFRVACIVVDDVRVLQLILYIRRRRSYVRTIVEPSALHASNNVRSRAYGSMHGARSIGTRAQAPCSCAASWPADVYVRPCTVWIGRQAAPAAARRPAGRLLAGCIYTACRLKRTHARTYVRYVHVSVSLGDVAAAVHRADTLVRSSRN